MLSYSGSGSDEDGELKLKTGFEAGFEIDSGLFLPVNS